MKRKIKGQQLKLTRNDEPPFYALLECSHTVAFDAPFQVGSYVKCPICHAKKPLKAQASA